MPREIYVCSFPDTIGGAATECLHALKLLRDHDVVVHLVPLHKLTDPVRAWCESAGITVDQYHAGIFKGRIVTSWNYKDFLSCLIDHHARGARPRQTIWFSCMTEVEAMQRWCHRRAYIDRWGFVSDYQRKRILSQLDASGPVLSFEGYKPFFDPYHPLQGVAFEYLPPDREFVVGRVSRDDPTKFSADTWELFGDVDPGTFRFLNVAIMGFGPRAQEKLGLPPDPARFELIPPNALTINVFLSRLHCLIHKTGGSRESFGRFVLEAHAAGVPVVVERDYAFPEFIIHGETGFLCSSSEEMVETASMLARDESTRKRIIYQAYEHLMSKLIDPAMCWAPWERLLQECG